MARAVVAVDAAARAVAQTYGLPLLDDAPEAAYVLRFEDDALVLSPADGSSGAVKVDFIGGRLGYRRQHGGGVRQPLSRAVGIRSGERPSIVDATAGLGRDAFVLAGLGCRVTMVERAPAIAALLADGLRRAQNDDALAEWLPDRLTLVHADGAEYLAGLSEAERPDVVLLDPMYPERSKAARVKKEMQALQAVVGPDMDSHALLAIARRTARKRVVVKRPKGAPPIDGLKPDTEIQSPNTRYDVYLCREPVIS
jgi:16S rRNA (guanine1516-N2)-methyltransferase